MSDMYALTLTPASKYCGVSTRVVQKFRREGLFPNAFKDDAGHWRIPTQDLDNNTEAMKADPNEQRKVNHHRSIDRLEAGAMAITEELSARGELCSKVNGVTCPAHKVNHGREDEPAPETLHIEFKDGSRLTVEASSAKFVDDWFHASNADGSAAATVARDSIKYVVFNK